MATTSRTLRTPASTTSWTRATATILFVNSVIAAYLEVRLHQDGEQMIPAVGIIMVIEALLAALIAATGRRALCAVAAVLMLVTLAGTSPHSVDNIVNGSTLEKHVFGVIELVGVVAGLVVAALAWWRTRTADGGR